MMQRTTAFSIWIALTITPWFLSPCFAARFIAFTPQSDSAPATASGEAPASGVVAIAPTAEAIDQSWNEYFETWQAHARNPADASIRQRLGLPANSAVETTAIDGRTVARLMPNGLQVNWVAPLGVETEHFLIIADVPDEIAIRVAVDLENFHAVWTQMFFPLWKDRQRWDRALVRAANRQSTSRSNVASKMRVLVLRDRDQYQRALKSEGPQINQSTGYYSGTLRTTFLLHDARDEQSAASLDETRATRYHELTHQLLAEASDSKLRAMPGERSGFWLAEGIACYMESTSIQQGYATIGGWESSRLQFARHRVLGLGETPALESLQRLGRMQFQRHADLPSIYAFAAAETHRAIDQNEGDGLHDMITQLAKLYQIRRPTGAGSGLSETPAGQTDLATYLKLEDDSLSPIIRNDLINLCLSRCNLSAKTLDRIAPQQYLVWLDLSALKVGTEDVARLCPQVNSLKQLSLEATAVDDSISAWIANATSIEELDLSWTSIGDATIASVPAAAPLQTLWLTGSGISDASIDRIAAWRSLKRIDFQRTKVTDAGRERLARLRPDVNINPLELVTTK